VVRELISHTRKVIPSLASSAKLLIHVFANATSLAPTLVQHEVISHPNVLHEFINGFNSVDELATFVNVGRGKELTDTKINGTLLRLVSNLCRLDEDVHRNATM
jgi:hypothetical protein